MPNLTQARATLPESTGKALVDFVKRIVITPANLDAGNDYRFPVEAGQWILGVRVVFTTAFDNAADLDVGDTDADGFIAQASVDPTSINTSWNSVGSGAAYGSGKYYAALDNIIFAFTATPTVGKCIAEILIGGYDAGFERGVINNSGL